MVILELFSVFSTVLDDIDTAHVFEYLVQYIFNADLAERHRSIKHVGNPVARLGVAAYDIDSYTELVFADDQRERPVSAVDKFFQLGSRRSFGDLQLAVN